MPDPNRLGQNWFVHLNDDYSSKIKVHVVYHSDNLIGFKRFTSTDAYESEPEYHATQDIVWLEEFNSTYAETPPSP